MVATTETVNYLNKILDYIIGEYGLDNFETQGSKAENMDQFFNNLDHFFDRTTLVNNEGGTCHITAQPLEQDAVFIPIFKGFKRTLIEKTRTVPFYANKKPLKKAIIQRLAQRNLKYLVA